MDEIIPYQPPPAAPPELPCKQLQPCTFISDTPRPRSPLTIPLTHPLPLHPPQSTFHKAPCFDPCSSGTVVSCLIPDSHPGDNAMHVPSNDFDSNDFDTELAKLGQLVVETMTTGRDASDDVSWKRPLDSLSGPRGQVTLTTVGEWLPRTLPREISIHGSEEPIANASREIRGSQRGHLPR
jgi:hypothetical protein